MAVRESGLNFLPTDKLEISIADNPGLSAVDVTARVRYTLTAVWAGPLPTTAAPGIELVIPKIHGSAITWTVARMTSRVSILHGDTVVFKTQKSAGGGVFSATDIQTTTHTTSDYEKAATASGTLDSGQLLRINFLTIPAGDLHHGGTYCVELEAST